MFVAVLDLRTLRLRYSNGGHNPPFVISPGHVRQLDTAGSGVVLGAFEGLTYETSELSLHAGDGLLLYTDGVTEAADLDRTLFSEHRLTEFLSTADAAPEQLIRGLTDEVRRFAGGAQPADDMTALALRCLIPPGSRHLASDSQG